MPAVRHNFTESFPPPVVTVPTSILLPAQSGPEWLLAVIHWLCNQFPPGEFLSYPWNMQGLIAIALVGMICGAVGSLVVGNRMAFFSDALAHCAFAGVALGLLLGVVTGAGDEDFAEWVTLVMIVFGIVIGLGIAFVREFTAQANDTVIGVFYAGAIGLGAVFLKAGSGRRYLPPEDFLFGNLVTIQPVDLLVLAGLTVLAAVVLGFMYNQLLFTSFNRSLALSRRIPVRLCNYLFIVLLALIVNLCLKVVGAMLINALLVVPAATAANLGRNMRQLFWWSMLLCLAVGVGGFWLSWDLRLPSPGGTETTRPGESGTIVVLAVLLFFLSMWVPMLRRWWAERKKPGTARV